ncbi:MAG: biotin transporter BioY [Treponema sp.]|nr:biotin transporter BioY [Treponema sp.]MCL2251520.1 biotin transporter BioY [Treponema sp.]
MVNKISTRTLRNRYVFTAVFAAMIAVSGFIIIPLPGIPVPLVLKNLFIVLSGTILGSFYGAVAVFIFIIAGILGIPLFVLPGVAVFSTPLGGYIIGYFFASLIAGLICGLPKTSEKKVTALFLIRLIIASFLGFIVILICGVLYMMRLNSMSFIAAFSAGALPYLIGDFIKLLISIPLALKLRPIAARYINE